MVNIYVYADNKTQLHYYYKIINKYLLTEHLEHLFHCATTNPYTLLKESKQKKRTGLYFLDIGLRTNNNGLHLASRICEIDPRGYIVFFTDEATPQSYPYNAGIIDFIRKDQQDTISDNISRHIKSAIKSETLFHTPNEDLLTLKAGSNTFQINQEDILFVESDTVPHYLLIHTPNGIKRIPGSLKHILALLDGRFHRCHNSIIVNLDHVVYFSASKHLLYLDSGETCPVSIRLSSRTRCVLLEND